MYAGRFSRIRYCLKTRMQTMSPYSRARRISVASGSRRTWNASPNRGAPFGPGGSRISLTAIQPSPTQFNAKSPYLMIRSVPRFVP